MVVHGDNPATALHDGGLLGGLGGYDLLGGSTTLQHRTQLQFLRLHASQELNPLAELVGLGLKAAKAGLLLFRHGLRGSLTLGRVIGHRLHLGDNGGQFFEQCLDLVHEDGSCVRGVATNRRLPRTYGASPRPMQLCGLHSKRLHAADLTSVNDLLAGVTAPAPQVASLVLAASLTRRDRKATLAATRALVATTCHASPRSRGRTRRGSPCIPQPRDAAAARRESAGSSAGQPSHRHRDMPGTSPGQRPEASRCG